MLDEIFNPKRLKLDDVDEVKKGEPIYFKDLSVFDKRAYFVFHGFEITKEQEETKYSEDLVALIPKIVDSTKPDLGEPIYFSKSRVKELLKLLEAEYEHVRSYLKYIFYSRASVLTNEELMIAIASVLEKDISSTKFHVIHISMICRLFMRVCDYVKKYRGDCRQLTIKQIHWMLEKFDGGHRKIHDSECVNFTRLMILCLESKVKKEIVYGLLIENQFLISEIKKTHGLKEKVLSTYELDVIKKDPRRNMYLVNGIKLGDRFAFTKF